MTCSVFDLSFQVLTLSIHRSRAFFVLVIKVPMKVDTFFVQIQSMSTTRGPPFSLNDSTALVKEIKARCSKSCSLDLCVFTERYCSHHSLTPNVLSETRRR